MKWSIPAKTFLLGEYAAIAGAPAILLTTSPCFEISLSHTALQGIHHESPAGRWWIQQGHTSVGLQWSDPYQGIGGMGASSAQFIGAYLASRYLQEKLPNRRDMLDAYLQCASHEHGLGPSGYDVLTQSLRGCIYISRQQNIYETYAWPFKDIAFLLLHTGQKLATHQHLQTLTLPSIHQLSIIVEMAKSAFERVDSLRLVEAVNNYHQQLTHMNLVAEHSLKHIASLRKNPDVLAIKGCGALGADVLLLLLPLEKRDALRQQLSTADWKILATNEDLYNGKSLI